MVCSLELKVQAYYLRTLRQTCCTFTRICNNSNILNKTAYDHIFLHRMELGTYFNLYTYANRYVLIAIRSREFEDILYIIKHNHKSLSKHIQHKSVII